MHRNQRLPLFHHFWVYLPLLLILLAACQTVPPVRPTPTAPPTPQATPTPAPLDVLTAVKDLKAAVQASYPDDGWIWQYSVVSHPVNRGYTAKLPDGSPFPSSFIQDRWFHVNHQKLVDKTVYLTKSMDHKILFDQVSDHGLATGPWFDEPKPMEPRNMGDFDMGFLDQVTAFTNPNIYTAKQLIVDGKPRISIVATELGPIHAQPGDIDIQAIVTEALFDPLTGWEVQEETIYELADGTKLIIAHFDIETHAKVLPPNEILDRLESAFTPK